MHAFTEKLMFDILLLVVKKRTSKFKSNGITIQVWILTFSFILREKLFNNFFFFKVLASGFWKVGYSSCLETHPTHMYEVKTTSN